MPTPSQSQPPAAGQAAHTPISGLFAIIEHGLGGDGPSEAEARAALQSACNSHEIVCGLLRLAALSVSDEQLRNEINETLRSL